MVRLLSILWRHFQRDIIPNLNFEKKKMSGQKCLTDYFKLLNGGEQKRTLTSNVINQDTTPIIKQVCFDPFS